MTDFDLSRDSFQNEKKNLKTFGRFEWRNDKKDPHTHILINNRRMGGKKIRGVEVKMLFGYVPVGVNPRSDGKNGI